jgi:hypothetical protein
VLSTRQSSPYNCSTVTTHTSNSTSPTIDTLYDAT